MQHWHLIISKPREEARAEQQLRNQGFEVFHPLLKRYKLQHGRQKAIIEPLFARYLFIRLDDEKNDWSTIRSTRGVSGLVRFTEFPAVVPEPVLSDLLARMDENGIIDQTSEEKGLYKPGDRVEIISGSFKGWQAIVKEQKDETRVTLMLEMLGKMQTLKVPIAELSTP